jgi:hypothetical protein
MQNDLEGVLDEIEQLTGQCWHFERKYGLSSDRFAELYDQGRVADDTTERREDAASWIGCWRALQVRLARRHELERQLGSPILRST